ELRERRAPASLGLTRLAKTIPADRGDYVGIGTFTTRPPPRVASQLGRELLHGADCGLRMIMFCNLEVARGDPALVALARGQWISRCHPHRRERHRRVAALVGDPRPLERTVDYLDGKLRMPAPITIPRGLKGRRCGGRVADQRSCGPP